jgi:histone demethylase JARID1
MISPIELKKHKIKILRTVQKAGEFLFTMGGTYHAGFSLGLNCSEAVNVAPTQWFQEYEKAVNLYRKQGNVKKVEKFY